MSVPSWLESARYYVALSLWLSLPAAVGFWLLIHPLAAFWRRRGLAVAYSVATLAMVLVGGIAWQFREPGLGDRGPMRPVLVALGLALYAVAVVIEAKCRRHLKLRTLVGVPELKRGETGVLLTEGIYAHTRNPRYLDVMIGLAGWALILNIGGLYWMTLATGVGFYGIAILEERELRRRFGVAYDDYYRRVPRLVPRSWRFLRD